MNEKYEADLFNYLATAVSNNVKLMGKDQTVNALKQYIEANNPNGFTRSEGTRESILKVPNNKITKIMGMSVDAFVIQFVNLNNESVLNKKLNNGTNNKVVGVMSALKQTAKKLSESHPELTEEQVYTHIYNSIDKLASHDYSCITRDNDQRKNVHDILENMNANEFYGAIKLYLDGFRYDVADLNELKTTFANIVMGTNLEKEVTKSK